MIATAAMWYAMGQMAKKTDIPPWVVFITAFIDLYAWTVLYLTFV